ncbi:hypothetical protein BJV74DRAFT_860371 [Russula compacta]|nr:hypothetical protein BJV74DRAFT_860371 [Russula compacta]
MSSIGVIARRDESRSRPQCGPWTAEFSGLPDFRFNLLYHAPSPTMMDRHASAILEVAESWDWPPTYCTQTSGEQGGRFRAITPKLLSGFIAESQALGGTLLDQFWVVVGQCHLRLEENIQILRDTEFSHPHHTETVLFEGVDRETINFSPVFRMATELFTHLCVAFMNPGGRKFARGTPASVSDFIREDTEELLRMAASEDPGKRKQALLKAVIFRRDGYSCPFTGLSFQTRGLKPHLGYIIPNSVHDKRDTIKCIAMLAGTAVRDLVVKQLNGPGNLMNIESNTHTAYNDILWGIEAREENGMVKYIYRNVPSSAENTGIIRLKDGDQINFGGGLEAARLGFGPNPALCNLQLAVARVLRMSGAAEVIAQMMDDGDDSDFPHIYIASPEFCNILTAQLHLAGGVLPK